MIDKKEALRRLKDIYASIPDVPCTHCHSCCGPILWFEPEELLIRDYLKTHHLTYIQWTKDEFERHQMRCPYLYNDRCRIYPVRPLVCRLQGAIQDLRCEHHCTELLKDDTVMKVKELFFSLIHDMEASDTFYGTRCLVNEVKKKR